MSDEPQSEAESLQRRPQVRLFTLADYVADELSGKLYISGAGLEWAGVPVHPDPHDDRRQFLSCYIVVRIAFPREIARETHIVEVLVRDAHGEPAGPESLFKIEMAFDLRNTPADFTELSGNLPMRIRDYPLTVDPNSVVFLHLLVDDELVGRLPVQLEPYGA